MMNKKQEYDSKNCVAYVAAKAFNTSVEEFEKFIGKKDRYSDVDFCSFALNHNHFVGVVFMYPEIDDTNNVLQTQMTINDSPAYLVVQSAYSPSEQHAVYWDGQKIYDPDPEAAGAGLSDYNLIAWYPILKIDP